MGLVKDCSFTTTSWNYLNPCIHFKILKNQKKFVKLKCRVGEWDRKEWASLRSFNFLVLKIIVRYQLYPLTRKVFWDWCFTSGYKVISFIALSFMAAYIRERKQFGFFYTTLGVIKVSVTETILRQFTLHIQLIFYANNVTLRGKKQLIFLSSSQCIHLPCRI